MDNVDIKAKCPGGGVKFKRHSQRTEALALRLDFRHPVRLIVEQQGD